MGLWALAKREEGKKVSSRLAGVRMHGSVRDVAQNTRIRTKQQERK